MITGKVISVNLSGSRGPKSPVEEINITDDGIEKDVHKGHSSRQVSLLDITHMETFGQITGYRPEPGSFAENITVEGFGKVTCKILDTFKIGDAVLEVTSKGKPFHDKFSEAGNYVMPREGIFCRVKSKGRIHAGMPVTYHPKVFQVKVITLSDRAYHGVYQDESGPSAVAFVRSFFQKTGWQYETEHLILPDNSEMLENAVMDYVASGAGVIITTGGTGIGPHDITVDTLKTMIEKEIPGIMDMIRMKYGIEKPNALISRSIAGVISKCLVFALPGSPKAVNEYMTEINKMLQHLIFMLHGIDNH